MAQIPPLVPRPTQSRVRQAWVEPAPFCTMVYRSRAVTPFDDAALQALVQTAQKNNRDADVTGFLVYADGHFVQWLEGPREGLVQVWDKIRVDQRHTDIQVLGDASTEARFFPDWAMRLGGHGVGGGGGDGLGHAVLVTAQTLAMLRGEGGAMPAFGDEPMQPWHRLAESDQALVQRLIDTEVIPQLVARGQPAGAAPVGAQRSTDFRLDVLLPLLMGSDPAAAFALLDGLMAQAGSLSALCTSLLEPAARRLGDLWADDACSGFDVTLGLCRLQQAFRQHCRSLPPPERQIQVRKVLVATPPGESHLLGTVVNTQLLWQAGWDAQCAFPPDAQTLRSLVASTWFDAVSLTLSPAFAQPQQLPQLADTITTLRAASLNQGLAVVVQGRLFNDANSAEQAAASVGADACNPAADQIVLAVQQVLVRPRS